MFFDVQYIIHNCVYATNDIYIYLYITYCILFFTAFYMTLFSLFKLALFCAIYNLFYIHDLSIALLHTYNLIFSCKIRGIDRIYSIWELNFFCAVE